MANTPLPSLVEQANRIGEAMRALRDAPKPAAFAPAEYVPSPVGCSLALLASAYRVVETNVGMGLGVVTQLLKPDPRRWWFGIANTPTNAITISTFSTVVANSKGIVIGQNAFFEMEFHKHTALVQSVWFGISPAAITVQVFEALFVG